MTDIEYIKDRYTKQLNRLNEEITKQLSNPKFYNEVGAFNKQRKIALYDTIRDELMKLSVLDKNSSKALLDVYTLNVEDTLKQFEKITGKKFNKDWNYTDSKDIVRLQEEHVNYLNQAQQKYYKGFQQNLDKVELENKKYIAQIVQDQAENQIIGGDLLKQSVSNVMQQMTDIGLTSFIYADSQGRPRSINLRSYAEIQIDSSISYATNQAILDSNEQLENDLVQFSSHGTCCPVCGTYAEGRIYSTKKSRTDYPYLNDIPGFNKGYRQLHVKCRHRLTAYYEDYVDNAEENKRLSNLPFDDRRTQAQKNKYDKGQELHRYRLAKRNNLDKRKALAESKEEKDKRKIKRLEETSRRYTQKMKEIKKEL